MVEASATIEIDGWTLRQRVPQGPGPHRLLLMLHGWTGDENAMWIFAAKLPPNAWLVAPRGLHPAAQGGYSWTLRLGGAWPQVDEFRPAAQKLLDWLTPANFPGADVAQVDLLGFSQGAALAFTLALLHPQRVQRAAGLSGFVPAGADALAAAHPLEGMPVFLAHGTQDAIVPIERARQAAEIMQTAGANISFCEDAVGHKLSATCFRSLADFFAL